MKEIKILHILSQQPDATGSGIFLQAMIRQAESYGFKNYLVAGFNSNVELHLEYIKNQHCEFVRFDKADVSFKIPGMSDIMPYDTTKFSELTPLQLDEYEKVFTEKIKTAVDTFKPDIIHSHHLWIVSALTRLSFPHIPMVTSCHGSDIRQFQNCIHLRERVLKGCQNIDTIMVLHEAQKYDVARLYNIPLEKNVITGTGFNTKLFHSNKKPYSHTLELVYAGKLSNAKGVPWLLQALQTIDAPAWRLHLLGGGSGEEKDNCLTLAKQLGEKVVVHGAVSQIKLAQIMREADVFVLPSFFEGLPLVLLEGLASGCRIVTTNLPGVKELLGDLQVDFISKVELPRLKNTDQPFKEDETEFIHNLKEALKNQLDLAHKNRNIDIEIIQKRLDSYSWQGVFEKVRDVYGKNIINSDCV